VDGMVVDFNDAKPVIKKAIADLDHKLFINERYVTGRTATHVDLSFATSTGVQPSRSEGDDSPLGGRGDGGEPRAGAAPEDRPKMPQNVEAVGVYVYEGLNKGTHLWLGSKEEA